MLSDDDVWESILRAVYWGIGAYSVLVFVAFLHDVYLARSSRGKSRVVIPHFRTLRFRLQEFYRITTLFYYVAIARFFINLTACVLYVYATYRRTIPSPVRVLNFLLASVLTLDLWASLTASESAIAFVFSIGCVFQAFAIPSLFGVSGHDGYLNFAYLCAYSVYVSYRSIDRRVQKDRSTTRSFMFRLFAQGFTLLFLLAAGIQMLEIAGDIISADYLKVWDSLGDWHFFNALYFVVITLTTVGYGDFSPATLLGRVFTIFMVILGVVVFAEAAGQIYEHLRQVRGSGSLVKRANARHVIVCGNPQLSDLVRFTTAFFSKSRVSNLSAKVLVLVEEPTWTESEWYHNLARNEFLKKRVEYLVGSVRSGDDLGRARLSSADAVFVLSTPSSGTEPAAIDTSTMMDILSIRNFRTDIPVFATVLLKRSLVQLRVAQSTPSRRDDPELLFREQMHGDAEYHGLRREILEIELCSMPKRYHEAHLRRALSDDTRCNTGTVEGEVVLGGVPHMVSFDGRVDRRPREGDARDPCGDGMEIPRQAGEADLIRSSSICLQDIHAAVMAAHIKANGVGTLITNMVLDINPQSSRNDPAWLSEYQLGACCDLVHLIIPPQLDQVRLDDIAVQLFDHGLVLLTTASDATGRNRSLVLDPSVRLRAGDIGMFLTYHKAHHAYPALILAALKHEVDDAEFGEGRALDEDGPLSFSATPSGRSHYGVAKNSVDVDDGVASSLGLQGQIPENSIGEEVEGRKVPGDSSPGAAVVNESNRSSELTDSLTTRGAGEVDQTGAKDAVQLDVSGVVNADGECEPVVQPRVNSNLDQRTNRDEQAGSAALRDFVSPFDPVGDETHKSTQKGNVLNDRMKSDSDPSSQSRRVQLDGVATSIVSGTVVPPGMMGLKSAAHVTAPLRSPPVKAPHKGPFGRSPPISPPYLPCNDAIRAAGDTVDDMPSDGTESDAEAATPFYPSENDDEAQGGGDAPPFGGVDIFDPNVNMSLLTKRSDGYIPDGISRHIIISVEGSSSLHNLPLLVKYIWRSLSGRKRKRHRDRKTPLVVVSPHLPADFRAAFSRYDGRCVFFVEDPPSSRATWRRARLQTAKGVVMLADYSLPWQQSDARTIFSLMTLDTFISNDQDVFVVAELVEEKSLEFLREPHAPRRVGVDHGDEEEADDHSESSRRNVSVRSDVQRPSKFYVNASIGTAVNDSTQRDSEQGQLRKRLSNLATSLATKMGTSASRGGQNSSGSGIGGRLVERERSFLNSSDPESDGSPGGSTDVYERSYLSRARQGILLSRARYASGDLLLPSAGLTLLVREYLEPGFVHFYTEVLGAGNVLGALKIRLVRVPSAMFEAGFSVSTIGDDRFITYRELFVRLMRLGCTPLGLYRSGAAPVRVPVKRRQHRGADIEAESIAFVEKHNCSLRRKSREASPELGLKERFARFFADIVDGVDQEGYLARQAAEAWKQEPSQPFTDVSDVGEHEGTRRRLSPRIRVPRDRDDGPSRVDCVQSARNRDVTSGPSAAEVNAARMGTSSEPNEASSSAWRVHGNGDESKGHESQSAFTKLWKAASPLRRDKAETDFSAQVFEERGLPGNKLPYVLTMPEPYTLVSERDGIYILCSCDFELPKSWGEGYAQGELNVSSNTWSEG